jgi:hypothetical protein
MIGVGFLPDCRSIEGLPDPLPDPSVLFVMDELQRGRSARLIMDCREPRGITLARTRTV